MIIFNLTRQMKRPKKLNLNVRVLSLEDTYGGKICAALDRQHPRDLFDIKLLLENEGLTEKIKKAFIVYLISHDRPIVEVLNPGLQDIKQIFENEFAGMTLDLLTCCFSVQNRPLLPPKLPLFI